MLLSQRQGCRTGALAQPQGASRPGGQLAVPRGAPAAPASSTQHPRPLRGGERNTCSETEAFLRSQQKQRKTRPCGRWESGKAELPATAGRADGRRKSLRSYAPLHQFVLQLFKMIEFSEEGPLERKQNQQQPLPPKPT